MKCLICGMERAESGIPCKLCGMLSPRPVASGRNEFCCRKCAADFQSIMEKAQGNERGVLMEREVII